MKADIITIGDEILIGQIVDTNSAYLASRLNDMGFIVRKLHSISDTEQAIINTLDEAIQNSDLVLITGGLGPTNDDITKKALRNYFGGNYIFDKPALTFIQKLSEKRGLPMSERNKAQALVPSSCQTLRNRAGSAPGMLFRKQGTSIISMPGVPFEMKDIFENEVVKFINNEFELPARVHRTILTSGIPESVAADMLREWEEELPENARFAYLPSPGRLRLRISLSGVNHDLLNQQLKELVDSVIPILGEDKVYGFDNQTLEEIIGINLVKRGFTLAVAESCTGGYISQLITSIPGASDYFKGSVTAYANEIKQGILGIPNDLIKAYGAVSSQVVEKMALGVKEIMHTDFALATSGIAGPTGGTADKPLGTTWFAVASPDDVFSTKHIFGDTSRERNILRASYTAINLLRNTLNRFG